MEDKVSLDISVSNQIKASLELAVQNNALLKVVLRNQALIIGKLEPSHNITVYHAEFKEAVETEIVKTIADLAAKYTE